MKDLFPGNAGKRYSAVSLGSDCMTAIAFATG
jgi:hypothetical protein